MADFSNLKVLLVDDERSVRKAMKWPLEAIGFAFVNIMEAENGIEALRILRKKKEVGLVISEVEMDGMSGLELIKEMKKNENLKNIPFIFVTIGVYSDNTLRAAGPDPIELINDYRAYLDDQLGWQERRGLKPNPKGGTI